MVVPTPFEVPRTATTSVPVEEKLPFAASREPDALRLPTTSRGASGVAVPMPTKTRFGPVPPSTRELLAPTTARAPMAVALVSPVPAASARNPMKVFCEPVVFAEPAPLPTAVFSWPVVFRRLSIPKALLLIPASLKNKLPAPKALGSGQPVDLRQQTALAQAEMIVPEWSPAGDWIACGDPQNRLMLVRPDNGESRTIGQSGPVAWSGDGKALFQLRYEDHSLVRIDPATGRASVLRDVGDALPHNQAEPTRRLTLTRDGTKVVYSVVRPREEIWLLSGLRPAVPWLARIWPW